METTTVTTSSSSAPWDDLAAAVRSGAIVLDTPDPSGLLEVGGADRVRFLNGYVTCQVEGLAVGTGTYGFVTTVKGRVQSDLVALALEDSLLLRVPTDRREAVVQHLGKYILADRVRIEDRTSRSVTLLGSAGWEIARRAAPSVAEAATRRALVSCRAYQRHGSADRRGPRAQPGSPLGGDLLRQWLGRGAPLESVVAG